MRASIDVGVGLVDEALSDVFVRIGRAIAARWPYGRTPLASRRGLQDVFGEVAAEIGLDRMPYLALLFGSLARGETARDADLLVVTASAERHYWRFRGVEGSVDFNTAPVEWLCNAWTDPEWGYCLSEGFVLQVTDPSLESAWRDSVQRYWTGDALRGRLRAHRTTHIQLVKAAALAEAAGAELTERFLRHEAVRSAACELIERFGLRVYSHRTFLAETLRAARRAGESARDTVSIMSGLTEGEASARQQATANYVKLRGVISDVLRRFILDARAIEPGVQALSPLTRTERMAALLAIVAGNGLVSLEQALGDAEADTLLPARVRAFGAQDAASAMLSRLERMGDMPARRSARAIADVRRGRPIRSEIVGARWAEVTGDRLKLIVDTGGCRTPTCRFCVLPRYAGARSNSPVEVVRRALQIFRPRELALYNDGSLLNPREVSTAELSSLAQVIRESGIQRLWVESIPRFVTRDRLSQLRAEAAVAELGVSMGLQCVNNRVAMFELGRPDATTVFDRAIDVLHKSDVRVRLYLLWGYASLGGPEASQLLLSSLKWARERGPLMVTVCPYVLPDSQRRVPASAGLCDLRQLLDRVVLDGSHLTVALSKTPSCGVAYAEMGCTACEDALRGVPTADRRPCQRQFN